MPIKKHKTIPEGMLKTSRDRWVLQFLAALVIFTGNSASAINRVSVATGNYNNAGTWSPAGVPVAGDQITIQNSHVVNIDIDSEAGHLTIATGGKLTFSPSKKISIHGNFLVYGIAEIVDGDLDLVTPGASFKIGATGALTWSPYNNTSSGASLFTNGIESFHPASTLIIKKWYNYSNVPLGAVVTGNFGNLNLSTLTNGLLYEWNQNNEFQNHLIQGTLTIDQGWIVLDKSGAITNTTIGAIYLNNINSYLDFHSGNHPGSFDITTASITNIGGKLNGLYNGEGTIHLQVNGDFTNLGNIVLIYNSGIQGIANGNASMQVTGHYLQTAGDFRGIFNLSSTTTGKVDLEFGSMKLTGGIFMGQYACHTSGNKSNFKINGNLDIDFSSANSKFRGNGLTTLSGIDNNLNMELIIEGDLNVKGTPAAEFTSSGSTGPETVIIKGTSSFEGCTSSFNFGSHSTSITMYENMELNGGTVYFSRTDGALFASLNKNLNLQSGNLTISGGNGNSNLIINGNYDQTGGSLFFHNNNADATSDIIYATVHGNFSIQSGNITFDNNSASTAQHMLSLNGELFSIGGTATINTSVSPSNPRYGIIYYDQIGSLNYSQIGNAQELRNVKQIISSECIFKINNGNLQVAESIQATNDMLMVSGNGILDLGDHQLYGNNLNLHTSVLIKSAGRLRISGEKGLYDGTINAAINSKGNMIFTLHEKSIVEYYGTTQQTVTGVGQGSATSVDQQYGILEINKIRKSARLNGNQVIVRSGMVLSEGELDLNNFNITLNSGEPVAILANKGYIKSEGNSSETKGLVIWKNVGPGNHTVPFGITPENLLPFSFTPITGLGNEFAVSTRGSGPDNRPLGSGVLHLLYNGKEAGTKKLIDRWYFVKAQGLKAHITGTYLADENTTDPEYATKNFSFIRWTGLNWKLLGGTGTGSITEPGAVSVNSVTTWGALLMVANEILEAADILDFKATLIQDHVDVEWTAMANIAPEKYTVERSEDGDQFTDLFYKTAQPPSTTASNYKGRDNDPLSGNSYYRLIQHQPDGNLKYSQIAKIYNPKTPSTGIEIVGIHPNPFTSEFSVSYLLQEAADVEIKLTDPNGKLVYAKIIHSEEGKNYFEFTGGAKLAPGIYFLTVTNGASSQNFKLFHI